MPQPKREVVTPPEYVYVRVTRFGTEMAKDAKDAKAWLRVGVPVFRYKVESRLNLPDGS